jgi:hypothetical protein
MTEFHVHCLAIRVVSTDIIEAHYFVQSSFKPSRFSFAWWYNFVVILNGGTTHAWNNGAMEDETVWLELFPFRDVLLQLKFKYIF